MTGIPLNQVDWWAIRPGPAEPPDPERCTCTWQRDEDGAAECGDDSCQCEHHACEHACADGCVGACGAGCGDGCRCEDCRMTELAAMSED